MITTQRQIATTLFLLLLVVSTACKKDTKLCDSYTRLSGQEHLVDVNLLKDVPEFMDTLKKYPQLQLTSVINDEYMFGMHCNMFYKDLKIVNEKYSIFKGKSTGQFFTQSNVFNQAIPISLTPKINFNEAILIAKQSLDFNNTCISYRLGLYRSGNTEFKLIWEITGEGGLPLVVLDANTGEVYSQDRGIAY